MGILRKTTFWAITAWLAVGAHVEWLPPEQMVAPPPDLCKTLAEQEHLLKSIGKPTEDQWFQLAWERTQQSTNTFAIVPKQRLV